MTAAILDSLAQAAVMCGALGFIGAVAALRRRGTR